MLFFFNDIKYKQTGKSTVYIFHGISNVKKITTVFLHSYRNANVIWDVEKKIYIWFLYYTRLEAETRQHYRKGCLRIRQGILKKKQ